MLIELTQTEIAKILEYLLNPEGLSNGKVLDLIEKLERELEKDNKDNNK
ncbi:MAG: hypothetical protein PVJ67_04365 [Candidatus Pacearchaeota archaeon]|jgi:hypothetical protein